MSPADPHKRLLPKMIVAIAALSALSVLAGGAVAAGPESVSATALPAEVAIGAPVTVSGSVAGVALAGRPLALEAAPYPFRSFGVVAHTQSAADGSFSFSLQPTENARLRVALADSPGSLSATIPLTVDPRVAIHSRSLGPGRVRLSIRIVHTRLGKTGSSPVFWYTANRHSRNFKLAATSSTRELAPGVSYASAIVNPPARRFSWRVCLNPSWERAMGPAPGHGSCPARDFRLPDGR